MALKASNFKLLKCFNWGNGNSQSDMKYSISTYTLNFINAASEKYDDNSFVE